MKRKVRSFVNNWKTRKYMTLVLVFIIAVIAVHKAPNVDGKKSEEKPQEVEEENSEDKVIDKACIYQYPVEFGYPMDSNYNGQDMDVDYYKKTLETTAASETSDASEISGASKANMRFIEDGYKKLHTSFGDIYCSNSNQVSFIIGNGAGNETSDISKAVVMYGDKVGYIIDHFDSAKYVVPDNFYGKLLYNYTDKNGKSSQLDSRYIMIENNIPSIQITEGDEYEAADSVNIEVVDAGKIISGIHEESIECFINGNKYTPKEMNSVKSCKLADNLEVSADTTFTVTFPKDGTYELELSVSDNCGNTTKFKCSINVVNRKAVIL